MNTPDIIQTGVLFLVDFITAFWLQSSHRNIEPNSLLLMGYIICTPLEEVSKFFVKLFLYFTRWDCTFNARQ